MIQLLFITQSLEVNILVRTKMQRSSRLFISNFLYRDSFEPAANDGSNNTFI